jgi:hypothetical protein
MEEVFDDSGSEPGTGLVLYCDYDGVLHHDDVYWSLQKGIYMKSAGCRLFEWMHILEELLEPHPNVGIVLSTSWVRVKSFNYAKQQLTPSLQARVLGSTFHRREIGKRRFDSMSRGDQVLADVQRRRPTRWMALDNDDSGWPSQWRANLIKTQDHLGLSDAEVQEAIRSRLAEFEVITRKTE